MIGHWDLRLFPLVLMAVAAGCSRQADAHKAVFGSQEAAGVVRNATTVQAYRLKAPSYHQDTLDKYEETAGPIAVPADIANQLKQLLLDPDSYELDKAKSCEPVYGVRIEFVHQGRKVDVLLCYDCMILSVYDGGRYAGGEDFDRINGKLVAIAKKLFPKDETIQELK